MNGMIYRGITMKKTLNDYKQENQAPDWMTEEGFQTLSNGYLGKNESPNQRARAVCHTMAIKLNKPELEDKFYSYYEKRWLGFSSPIWSNVGTDKGLGISCFSIHLGDSVDSIFQKNHEMAMLTKAGGGVGVYLGDIRSRGASIKNNGASEGIIPWCKVFDSSIIAVNQGGTRKGANAFYLPVSHPDIREYLRIRRQVGDVNRQCLNSNHAICIDDEFMSKLDSDDPDTRDLWKEILITRFETGEPYIFYTGNVNRQLPQAYSINSHLFDRVSTKKEDFIVTSNICTEIFQYTDVNHTFICDLLSLNLGLWDEWKDSDLMYYAVYMLDGVLQEFIDKTENMVGMENSRRSAIKGRAIGVGGMGWHTLLQKKGLPFESLQAKLLNTLIWKTIHNQTLLASQDMAKEYGEPEWCVGTGTRHSVRVAIAPTVSNSLILSSVEEDISPSVEPIPANAYVQRSAKGTFMRKNKILEKLFVSKGKNDSDVWKSIVANEGSVQHLDFLTLEEKEIFLTAREINQFVIIKQAADRQKYIDQGQSINLFFTMNATPKYMSEVTKEAWRLGLKSLYYCRTSSVLKSDSGSRGYERKVEECNWCEG
jgi:ribonucleoside-diphosphate reductase alpha chain